MYIVITMRASPPYLKNNWQSVRRKKKKLSKKRNTLNLLILLHDAKAVRSHAKWSSSLPISWDRISIKLQLTGKSCLIIQFIMIKIKFYNWWYHYCNNKHCFKLWSSNMWDCILVMLSAMFLELDRLRSSVLSFLSNFHKWGILLQNL